MLNTMPFSSILEIIKKRAARYQSRNVAVLLKVQEEWQEVGESFGLAKEVRPITYKNGIVFLVVSSLAEAAHIRLKKQKIKEVINHSLKKDIIKDIKFLVREETRS